MTRILCHRCRHCRCVYTYQSSGYGCGAATNDPDYCPHCKQVVIDALAKVAAVVERYRELVPEGAERDKVIAEHERQKTDPPRISGGGLFDGMVCRQYRPGLFRLDPVTRQLTATMHITVLRVDSVEYDVSEWSDDSEPAMVERTMERDLRDGSTRPWRFY